MNYGYGDLTAWRIVTRLISLFRLLSQIPTSLHPMLIARKHSQRSVGWLDGVVILETKACASLHFLVSFANTRLAGLRKMADCKYHLIKIVPGFLCFNCKQYKMFIRAFLNISQTTGCRPASPINRIAFMFTQRSESAPNELIDTSLYNININAFIFFFIHLTMATCIYTTFPKWLLKVFSLDGVSG